MSFVHEGFSIALFVFLLLFPFFLLLGSGFVFSLSRSGVIRARPRPPARLFPSALALVLLPGGWVDRNFRDGDEGPLLYMYFVRMYVRYVDFHHIHVSKFPAFLS